MFNAKLLVYQRVKTAEEEIPTPCGLRSLEPSLTSRATSLFRRPW